MNQNIELNEKLALQEKIMVEVRETLEMHLFDIAVNHTIKAVSDIDRDDYPKMQQELKHALISIIMSHFCLEALANSIGMEFYGAHPDEQRRIKWAELEDLPLHKKMKHLSRVAYQDKTKSNDIKTINKSITELIEALSDLRHSIVHYQAIPEDIGSLKRTSRNEPISPEISRYTSQKAINAIGTVKLVVTAFNALSRKDYGNWVESILAKYQVDLEINDLGTRFKFNLNRI